MGVRWGLDREGRVDRGGLVTRGAGWIGEGRLDKLDEGLDR